MLWSCTDCSEKLPPSIRATSGQVYLFIDTLPDVTSTLEIGYFAVSSSLTTELGGSPFQIEQFMAIGALGAPGVPHSPIDASMSR